MDDQPLRNKVAVVTGAGRGIGKAIALAYARSGASIGCAARTQNEIEETAAIIRSEGGHALAVQTDVTDPDAVAHLFETVAGHFGGIDILVINAGANYDRRIVEDSIPADWLCTAEVNLTGAYYCAHAAIPHLIKRGAGKILLIGSGMGHRASEGNSAYACSKAGLWMLTRVLAQELWHSNISVNELIPGPVVTSIDDAYPQGGTPSTVLKSPEFESEWVKEPEDVIPLAIFLAAQPEVGPTAQKIGRAHV